MKRILTMVAGLATAAMVLAPVASAESCDLVDAAIIAHNNAKSTFIVPEEEAAANAYDREADALEDRAAHCIP